MKSLFFILSVFLLAIEAKNASAVTIEWPFYEEDGDIFADLEIGTPGQKLKVALHHISNNDDLQILPSTLYGVYDEKNSSSIKYLNVPAETKRYGPAIGQMASETFKLGDHELKGLNFTLLNTTANYSAHMGLGGSIPRNSFLYNVLGRSSENIFTIAFDDFPKTGVITFGGLDEKRCEEEWKDLDLADYYSGDTLIWGVSVDSLSVGKYSYKYPGTVLFTLYDEEITWPKTIYYSMLKAMGSTDGQSVPCSTSLVISFQIEDIAIELTPDMYLDKEKGGKDNVCYLRGKTAYSSSEYLLPRTVLDKYCLSVNHIEGVIGMALRKGK